MTLSPFESAVLNRLERIANALEMLAACTKKSGPEGHLVFEVDQPDGSVWAVDPISLEVDPKDEEETKE